ncbi:MAG: PIN domain-containing protein [Treponemataceae bacterium]|nr:PIN domain-containing protein [Treponemataceae bacterium]
MRDSKNNYAQTEESKVFFDSNILVYSADERDLQKKEIASRLINEITASGRGVVSTQCLQEFFNVAVKKLNLRKNEAKEYVEFFADIFSVVQVSVPLILNAVDISVKTQFSFWDSLVLSAANESNCIIVYSEDLNDGQIVGGTKILNPFAGLLA